MELLCHLLIVRVGVSVYVLLCACHWLAVSACVCLRLCACTAGDNVKLWRVQESKGRRTKNGREKGNRDSDEEKHRGWNAEWKNANGWGDLGNEDRGEELSQGFLVRPTTIDFEGRHCDSVPHLALLSALWLFLSTPF